METLLYIVGFLFVLWIGWLLRNKPNAFLTFRLLLILLTGFFIFSYCNEREKKEDILQLKINNLEAKQKAVVKPKKESENIEIREKVEIRDGVERREIITIRNGVETIEKTEKKISVFGEKE